MNERSAYLFFSVASDIGSKRFAEILRIYKTAADAYYAFAKEERDVYDRLVLCGSKVIQKVIKFANEFDVVSYEEKLRRKDIQFISSADRLYPRCLFDLTDPPIGLFIRGNSALLQEEHTKIAIVGTRKVTTYGHDVTKDFSSRLAVEGYTIVSGLAIGVDSIAHKNSIKERGKTIAVLGCGVDCVYPRENELLYNTILEEGGLIISEYPLSSRAVKGTFLMRNRIIAALSKGVLVTQAGEKSGALVTARVASDLKRLVFAVPGSIHSELSAGTTYLLKNGAFLTSNTDDIQKCFGAVGKIDMKNITGDLTSLQKDIVQILTAEEKTLVDIAVQLSLPVTDVLVCLSELEMKGIIKSKAGLFRIRN